MFALRWNPLARLVFVRRSFREKAMRNGKDIPSGQPPAWWPSDSPAPEPAPQPVWKISRWFGARPEPSLFQRCLAVHIYHASNQTSRH